MRGIVKICNSGKRPAILGKTKEGFPVVLHPGKSLGVDKEKADKLLLQNKNLIRQDEKIKTEKPYKKGK